MTGIIILAAGQSSRMGKPKQQLIYQGQNLLQCAIKTALSTNFRPVAVVLGAFADEILPGIKNGDVQIVLNGAWEEGMASSVRVGINELKKQPEVNQVLVMLCDQPHVSPSLLKEIVSKKEQTGQGIVACGYNNAIGVPVLFDRKYFATLLTLKGQEGAKKLLMAHADDVAVVDFPLGLVDIDTRDDYEMLIN